MMKLKNKHLSYDEARLDRDTNSIETASSNFYKFDYLTLHSIP